MTMCIGDGDGIVVPPYVGLALIPTVIISYSLLARYSVPSVFFLMVPYPSTDASIVRKLVLPVPVESIIFSAVTIQDRLPLYNDSSGMPVFSFTDNLATSSPLYMILT